MSKQKVQLDRIISLIGRWLAEIQGSNALNYFDINRISEGLSLKLLNLTFGFDLRDLNLVEQNFPGIDLGDSREGVAFQVSSQTSAVKIRHSLKEFFSRSYQKSYPKGLKMFLLTYKNFKPKSIRGFENTFNPSTDILNLKDLLTGIEIIYHTNSNKFLGILELLETEFGNEVNLSSDESLIKFRESKEKLKFYQKTFRDIHRRAKDNFIPFDCNLNGEVIEQNEVIPKLIQGGSLIITGPSGTGKSTLSRIIAVEKINLTYVPLFLQAKYYDSSLEAIIAKEINSYNYGNVDDFFTYCEKNDFYILLIIDGLNECNAEVRSKLLSELEAIADQRKVEFIISLQQSNFNIGNLRANRLDLSLPDLETKKLIAGRYCTVTDKMVPVLAAAATCIEAKLIGEIGSSGVDAISRFNLFDLFVRKKMGQSLQNMRLLRIVGGFFSEKIAYSITNRQMDNLLELNNFDSKNVQVCVASGLLEQKLDRISFVHEMFLEFFIADNITGYNSDPDTILAQLNLPKNKNLRILIIGAIDDEKMLFKVLDQITDAELLSGILIGECGEKAMYWTQVKLQAALTKVEEECRTVRFELTRQEYYPIKPKDETLLQWSSEEIGLLNASLFLLVEDNIFQEFFRIMGVMDATLDICFEELYQKAKDSKLYGLRSELFTASYAALAGLSDQTTVLMRLVSKIHSGFLVFNSRRSLDVGQLQIVLAKKSLKNGEFFLLLLMCKDNPTTRLLYPYILNALKNDWKFRPYHLKLAILDKIHLSYKSEEERHALIEAIDLIHSETTNGWMSTLLFDALAMLGGLEDDTASHEITVSEQLNRLLSARQTKSTYQDALGIFICQFDHPYAWAYSEAIDKLSKTQQQKFYLMALKANGDSMFEISLIFHAESTLGKKCYPYLFRYLKNPIPQPSMPQDGLNCFLAASIFLGKYDIPLRADSYKNGDGLDNSLYAYGEIIYWLNRTNLSREKKEENYRNAAKTLFDPLSPYIVETIYQTNRAFIGYNHQEGFKDAMTYQINGYFAEEIATAVRRALKNPGTQKGVFGFEREDEMVQHAINLLEEYGNISDKEILLPLTENKFYGSDAVQAIKKFSR